MNCVLLLATLFSFARGEIPVEEDPSEPATVDHPSDIWSEGYRSSLGEGGDHFCNKEFGYCFVDIITDAFSAQAICESFYGTSLATVTTCDQNDWIYATCKPADDCERVRWIGKWLNIDPKFTCGCIIGLNDFGRGHERDNEKDGWKWFDGTTEDTEANEFAAQQWAPSYNQPNDANLIYPVGIEFGQDCVSIIKDLSDHEDNRKWNDIACDSSIFKMPFFCNAPDESHYIWKYVQDSSSSSSSDHNGHHHHHL